MFYSGCTSWLRSPGHWNEVITSIQLEISDGWGCVEVVLPWVVCASAFLFSFAFFSTHSSLQWCHSDPIFVFLSHAENQNGWQAKAEKEETMSASVTFSLYFFLPSSYFISIITWQLFHRILAGPAPVRAPGILPPVLRCWCCFEPSSHRLTLRSLVVCTLYAHAGVPAATLNFITNINNCLRKSLVATIPNMSAGLFESHQTNTYTALGNRITSLHHGSFCFFRC